MKKYLLLLAMIVLLGGNVYGQNSSDFPFGKVTFATATTWKVGKQIWSDAVQTSFCSNKTDYDGGTYDNPKADCRSNPNYQGDLFSWPAVNAYSKQLCPAPWRVPTHEDFMELQQALNGKETGSWGAAMGGGADCDGSLRGKWGFYWSASPMSTKLAYHMLHRLDNIYENYYVKMRHDRIYVMFKGMCVGYSLRCVQD